MDKYMREISNEGLEEYVYQSLIDDDRSPPHEYQDSITALHELMARADLGMLVLDVYTTPPGQALIDKAAVLRAAVDIYMQEPED